VTPTPCVGKGSRPVHDFKTATFHCDVIFAAFVDWQPALQVTSWRGVADGH
jgi:hypothetical protein